MKNRYRVTQRNQYDVVTGQKDYRLLWRAKYVAFVNKGQGSYIFGNGEFVYTTKVEDLGA